MKGDRIVIMDCGANPLDATERIVTLLRYEGIKCVHKEEAWTMVEALKTARKLLYDQRKAGGATGDVPESVLQAQKARDQKWKEVFRELNEPTDLDKTLKWIDNHMAASALERERKAREVRRALIAKWLAPLKRVLNHCFPSRKD